MRVLLYLLIHAWAACSAVAVLQFDLTEDYLRSFLDASAEQPKLLLHRASTPGTSVVACTPSKNGITTTRSVFYHLAHPQAVTPHNPYDNSHFQWVDALPVGEALQLLTTKERVVRLAVLRNPYERVSSAYINKILEPKGFDYVLDYIRTTCNLTQEQISFSQFVQCITSQNPLTVDRHFAPQVGWCGLNHVPYHHYLTTSNLRAQLVKVMEDHQYTVYGIPRLNRALAKNKTHWRTFYDSNTRALVETYYAADFQFLGVHFNKTSLQQFWETGL